MSQSSFYSSNDPGVGAETIEEIGIRWSTRRRRKLKAVAADQLIVVKKGSVLLPRVGRSHKLRVVAISSRARLI